MNGKHDISESEEEGEEEVSNPKNEKMLDRVVDDASEYKAVKEAGALRLHDLGPSTELYLVTIPNDLLDPMNLVHSQMVVGGGKEREVAVGRRRYSLATYPTSSMPTSTLQLPSLFLPDQDGAMYKVADDRIRAQMVIRGKPHVGVEEEEEEAGVERVDLAALCSTKRHFPPSHLKTRHFLAPEMRESTQIPEQVIRRKRKKEEDSPLKVSKKKKKKKDTDHNIASSPDHQMSPQGIHSKKGKDRDHNITSAPYHQMSPQGIHNKKGKERAEPEISQDFIGLTPGNKNDKKSKKQKTIKQEVIVKQERFEENERGYLSEDLFADSPKKKKKKKKKSEKANLNITC